MIPQVTSYRLPRFRLPKSVLQRHAVWQFSRESLSILKRGAHDNGRIQSIFHSESINLLHRLTGDALQVNIHPRSSKKSRSIATLPLRFDKLCNARESAEAPQSDGDTLLPRLRLRRQEAAITAKKVTTPGPLPWPDANHSKTSTGQTKLSVENAMLLCEAMIIKMSLTQNLSYEQRFISGLSKHRREMFKYFPYSLKASPLDLCAPRRASREPSPTSFTFLALVCLCR